MSTPESRSSLRPSRVHVRADVDAPNRDWAATLPYSTLASAAWDRLFEYAWLREPRYGLDAGEDQTERLDPVHVLWVRNADEQATLKQQLPAHIRPVFVKTTSRRSG